MLLSLGVDEDKEEKGEKVGWEEKAVPRNVSILKEFPYPFSLLPDPSK